MNEFQLLTGILLGLCLWFIGHLTLLFFERIGRRIGVHRIVRLPKKIKDGIFEIEDIGTSMIECCHEVPIETCPICKGKDINLDRGIF